MAKIEWTGSKQIDIQKSLVSGDWHCDIQSNGNIFVSNYKIITAPCALGANEQDAFRQLIKRIGEYEVLLNEVRKEAEEHLAELENGKK